MPDLGDLYALLVWLGVFALLTLGATIAGAVAVQLTRWLF